MKHVVIDWLVIALFVFSTIELTAKLWEVLHG